MQREQKKKIWIGILAGVFVSVTLLLAIFVIGALYFFFGGSAEITKDVAEYEETMTKYSNLQTGFITFPERIPGSAENIDFYFSYQDTWDDPTCEVFLQCTYDEADYLAEVERLENTKKVYGTTERALARGAEGQFQYPAYMAIDGCNYAFEYALLTGNQQITYVYTSFIKQSKLHFDKKYLPSDYKKADYSVSTWEFGEGYNIYLEDVMENNGIIEGLSYDYTRE